MVTRFTRFSTRARPEALAAALEHATVAVGGRVERRSGDRLHLAVPNPQVRVPPAMFRRPAALLRFPGAVCRAVGGCGERAGCTWRFPASSSARACVGVLCCILRRRAEGMQA